MPDLSLPRGLAELQREMAHGRGLPPVEKWHPGFCGDSFMRIARDGTWFHQDTPIGRMELVRLFSTILRKDEEDYFLVTPAEKLSIMVDDLPFVAVLLSVQGAGRSQNLVFTTNVGDQVVAGPDHRIIVHIDPRSEQPSPQLHVRQGLNARIARTVFYDLVDLATAGSGADKNHLGIWSDGVFFRLGPLP